MLASFSTPNYRNLSLLFFVALLVRVCAFFFYVQHEERYHQADSMDYHNGAFCLSYCGQMSRPDNHEPFFWRTPGYPLYLAFFYHASLAQGTSFKAYASEQKRAIWWQLILNSFIPLILLFLALLLTGSLAVAWITAWISVFHLGLVLSSTFLLSEGLGLPFFYLFFLCFYAAFFAQVSSRKRAFLFVVAGLLLGIFTWIRPMGEAVVFVCSLLMLLFLRVSWRSRFLAILLFVVTFFATISGWYIRNHNLTGHWFFWSGSGPVLCAFTGPKVLRTVEGVPLDTGVKFFCRLACEETELRRQVLQGTGKYISRERVCLDIALPFILAHPWLSMYEWIKEVIKTAFDPYASQLVAFAANKFTYDEIEEFLPQKIAACLYQQAMPWPMRLLCWLDFLFMMLMWIGVIAGCWSFVIRRWRMCGTDRYCRIWLTTLPLCCAIIGLTGGFGYARLRLPVEPLLIIMALLWWDWLFTKGGNDEKKVVVKHTLH